jgi:hypothetical protein
MGRSVGCVVEWSGTALLVKSGRCAVLWGGSVRQQREAEVVV